MSNQTSDNNKRIAKNTLLLYFRMLFLMLVTLYTSRVVLSVLGVSDYGIYNVVGGIVAMFSVLSNSLTSAISRFITYELGNGNTERLKKVFSTAVSVQLALSGIVVLIAECIGVWFLNTQMQIPSDRLVAANWVFQFSIATFVINLISVPYNATIVAHEKMSAFAYISILEALGKLSIAFLVTVSPMDKLSFYALLMFLVALMIRFIYGRYCKRHFQEASYEFFLDKTLLRQMFSFAGWNFFGSGAFMLNTQGVNILMNIFFGVTVNAARGVATQVETAMRQFINSFMTAINPQIIKSYANKEYNYMYSLICRSSKFSSFLLIFFAVPIILETPTIFSIWLKEVPEYAVIFLRLSVLVSFVDCSLANSLMTAIFATGDIKRYQITVSCFGIMVFPLSWIFYYWGFDAWITYLVYFFIYCIILYVRLWLVKSQIAMPIGQYVKEVLLRVIPVLVLSFCVPILITCNMSQGLLRLFLVTSVSILCSAVLIFVIGLTSGERHFVLSKFKMLSSKVF